MPSNQSDAPGPSLGQVIAAARRIRPYVRRTPLIESPWLNRLTKGRVRLKAECLQPTGSFKVRGAANKILGLSPHDRAKGLVTASAGNHALGAAHAAAALGLDRLTIFLPRTAPRSKVEKLKLFPVEIVQAGDSYDQAHRAAADRARESGAVYLEAYDDIEVITGQATIGWEIMTVAPETEVVLVPIGGGGLMSGVLGAVKAIKPDCRVIGLQPAASPSAALSFEQGRAVEEYDHQPTLADGLAGGFGRLPFELARGLLDDIWIYDEEDLARAIVHLFDKEKLVVEASGAISIAPILAGRAELEEKNTVAILSGANIDAAVLAGLIK